MPLALIVENEVKAQKLLASLVKDYLPEVELIGITDNPIDAKEIVESQNVDIVFLDIELNNGTGFDFLESLEHIKFKTIFTTAYDHFAIKAIKHGAVDYLLKPYSPKELIAAVNKVKSANQSDEWLHEIKLLLSAEQKTSHSKISIKTSTGIYMVSIEDIVRVQADSSYSTFHLNDGNKIMASKAIGKFEERLPTGKFFRVHTSHLINLDYVESYQTEDGGYVVLKNKEQIPVSRRKKMSFIESLVNISG